MALTVHLSAILCVAMIAVGQVLFKSLALNLNRSAEFFGAPNVVLAVSAVALYGAATVLWIALLRHAPLGRLYPYMALSFILVGLMSRFFFNESLTAGYAAGLCLIVVGLIVIAKSQP